MVGGGGGDLRGNFEDFWGNPYLVGVGLPTEKISSDKKSSDSKPLLTGL